MNNRLYVENLPASSNESSLRELFSRTGPVTEIKMVLDPATGRSRGRAFVTMATPELAQDALKSFQSYTIEGRNIAVNVARPIEERPTGLIGHGFEAARSENPRPTQRPQRPQRRSPQGGGGGGGRGQQQQRRRSR